MVKPSLLLIHGLGSSARVFDAMRAQPSLQAFPSFAPDLPGFGAHHGDPVLTHPFETASSYLDNYVNDIAGDLVIVGHSMGGALGLKLAAAIPTRVKAYVSIEGNLIPEDCGLLSRNLAKATIPEEQAAMKAQLIAFAKTLTKSWQDWAEDLTPVDAQSFRNYAHDLVEGTDRGEWMRLFEALLCPKLYIHGDLYKDHKLLSVLPKDIVRHAPESGHFTMQDQPKICADFIAALIKPL